VNKAQKVTAIALLCVLFACYVLFSVDGAPVFNATASAGVETLSLQVKPVCSKPALWHAAWRVGTTQVSTVTLGISVQPSGTNVINPKLTYYVKAVCGTQNKRIVEGASVDVTLGAQFSNSTTQSIDSHLTALGVSTTQDQTVTYYIYARLEAKGVISGQTLTAESAETAFSTVTFDYGGLTSQVITLLPSSSVHKVYYGSGYDECAILDACTSELGSSEYSKLSSVDGSRVYIYRSSSTECIWAAMLFTFDVTGYNISQITQAKVKTVGYGYVEGTSASEYTLNVKQNGYWTEKARHVVALTEQSDEATYSNVATIVHNGKVYASTALWGSNEGENYAHLYVNYAALQFTTQVLSWDLSWSWANQPLSLVAVPAARLLVAAVLACFALLLLLTKPKRKSKLVCLTALIMLLAAALLGTGVVHAAQAMHIPDQWRSGDLAVYLQSFPFATTEVVDGAVTEKPADIEGDLTINLAVFNATEDNPVRVHIDGAEADVLAGEGFYALTYTLPVGSHSITVACDTKIFEQQIFYVKPKPLTPMMPLEEFLKRLSEQRTEIVTRMLFAAAAGTAAGVFAKRKTLKHTAWIYPVPAVLIAAGYVWMPNYYFLLCFGACIAVAYAVCPDFTKKQYVMLAMRNKLAGLAKVTLRRIETDNTGKAVLSISPRYWREGFIKRAEIKLENPAVTTLDLDGELLQTYIANDMQQSCDAIHVQGDPATKLALEEGIEGIEAMSRENYEAQRKLFVYEHMQLSKVAKGMRQLDDLTKTDYEKLLSVENFLSPVRAEQDQPAAQPQDQSNRNEKGYVE